MRPPRRTSTTTGTGTTTLHGAVSAGAVALTTSGVVVNGPITATGAGGWALVLWGIPLRLVLVYHVPWLVNSATHFCGYRNFDCPDLSRNCWWVAILSFGEGWHNNHHAFPHSARHGLRWFEFDITWQHIKLLRRLGWARRVREASYNPS